mgnify:FL=1
MSNIEEKIENLVKKQIEDLGYSLYDVQYVKEGQDYYLRIFIEKPNGSIDLNDCEKVNDGINDLLDKADYIKEQYFLEVSSTGLEKVLRRDEHLEQNIGKDVEVKLFKAVDINSAKNDTDKAENKLRKEQDEDKQNRKNKKSKKSKNSKQKEIIGVLENFDKEKVTLKLEDERTIDLERSNIAQVKLIFDWNSL